jgi:transposase-like protein
MPRVSSIAKHPKRKEIDKALVLPGASIRGIARTYRVSEDALSRYVKGGNIEQKIKKAQAAQDIVEADDLLKEIQEIQGHQKVIFKEAREFQRMIKNKDGSTEMIPDPDNKLALEALRDQSKIIELKGKVLGSFIKDNQSGPIVKPTQELSDEEIERRAREILAKRK